MKKEPKKGEFIPGLELAEGFYSEAVKPVLLKDFPDLKYSAALIGQGSEVLGFDTEMSTDHHWGPRVILFLTPVDLKTKEANIKAILSRKLPHSYRGYATNFSQPDPDDNGTKIMREASSGEVNHRVELSTIAGFFKSYLGVDIDKKMDIIDWLTLPQQKLRSIVAGKIFHDDLGLGKIREKHAWYPHDVWLLSGKKSGRKSI